MLSALATNEIGIHPIFGAFLFGVISPRGRGRGQTGRRESSESVTVTLLLPLFFAYIGLSTQFGLLGADPALWGWCRPDHPRGDSREVGWQHRGRPADRNRLA